MFATKFLSFAALLALSPQADTTGWSLQPADSSHGLLLTLHSGQPFSYRFECAGSEVIATQTGVTKLMDLKTGNQIGDDAGAVMSPGAAMMAIYGGKGDPKFVPAEAAKNPGGGWDLTIRVPKGDKQLKAVAKSDMMSLFTTGQTVAIMMDADARGKWADFIKGCQAGA